MKLKWSIEIDLTISSFVQLSMRLFLFYFSCSEPNAKIHRFGRFGEHMLTCCHYWPACIIIAYAMRFDLVLHSLEMDIEV